MDEAGEAPENMEALKTAVMEKLSEWYMRNHGVGTMANVEDMCTLLQVGRLLRFSCGLWHRREAMFTCCAVSEAHSRRSEKRLL